MIKITKTEEGCRVDYDFKIEVNIHEFIIIIVMAAAVIGATL